MIEFISQRNKLIVFFFYSASQKIRKLFDHFAGQRWIIASQGTDGIQAIENKMRLQLLSQVRELRFAHESLGFFCALFILVLLLNKPPYFSLYPDDQCQQPNKNKSQQHG